MRVEGVKRLAPKTDWDELNELIDWYEKNNPKAGMIGAPTLDELAARWEQITSRDFERHRAQHVVTLATNRAKVMPW